jgi:hypothetical protein
MNREAIMTALVNIVSGAANFRYVGRRVLPVSKIPAQPAAFVVNIDDTYERREPLPPKRTMTVEIFVYTNVGTNDDGIPGADLNQLVDTIDAALVPDNIMLNRQTLGGTCQHCWIEGKVEYYPADFEKQARAIIPVKILVP